MSNIRTGEFGPMRDCFIRMVGLVASCYEPKHRAMGPIVDCTLQKCYLGIKRTSETFVLMRFLCIITRNKTLKHIIVYCFLKSFPKRLFLCD